MYNSHGGIGTKKWKSSIIESLKCLADEKRTKRYYTYPNSVVPINVFCSGVFTIKSLSIDLYIYILPHALADILGELG